MGHPRRQRPGRAALRRWAKAEPALARFATPAEVVTRCQQRGDPRAADAPLGALLRLAGDDLARPGRAPAGDVRAMPSQRTRAERTLVTIAR